MIDGPTKYQKNELFYCACKFINIKFSYGLNNK